MPQSDARIESLHRAIAAIGSQSATARLLGISQASVWGWLNRGSPLPPEHVLAVESATGISRHDLRPDIYPREEGITHLDTPAPGTRHHFANAPERAR